MSSFFESNKAQREIQILMSVIPNSRIIHLNEKFVNKFCINNMSQMLVFWKDEFRQQTKENNKKARVQNEKEIQTL